MKVQSRWEPILRALDDAWRPIACVLGAPLALVGVLLILSGVALMAVAERLIPDLPSPQLSDGEERDDLWYSTLLEG